MTDKPIYTYDVHDLGTIEFTTKGDRPWDEQ